MTNKVREVENIKDIPQKAWTIVNKNYRGIDDIQLKSTPSDYYLRRN